jgi:hypothetical protein
MSGTLIQADVQAVIDEAVEVHPAVGELKLVEPAYFGSGLANVAFA